MYHLLVNVYIAANPGVFPPNMDLDLYESPDQLQDSFRNIFARNIGGGVRPNVRSQSIISQRLGLKPWTELIVVHLTRGQCETLKALANVTDEQIGVSAFEDHAALQAAGYQIHGVSRPPPPTQPPPLHESKFDPHPLPPPLLLPQ